MRDGFGTLAFLVSALATTATACSFLVSTGDLAGGGDPKAGGSAPASSGGSGAMGPSEPGIELGDALAPAPTAPTVGSGPDGGGDSSGDASLGSAPTGANDAGTMGSSLDASGNEDAAPGDAANGDAAAPPAACSVGQARVFLTSTLYNPDFGGVHAADTDCATRATAGGLGGRWRAWLSDTIISAPAHVYAAPNGYVLLDGTLVAASMTALTSGSLAHAIDLTELSAPAPDGYTEVWTGIDVTGHLANGGYCDDTEGDDWSSNASSASTPLVGHSNASDSTWTAAYLQYCDRTTVRLYCFETCGS